jgi:hypothetical protein
LNGMSTVVDAIPVYSEHVPSLLSGPSVSSHRRSLDRIEIA